MYIHIYVYINICKPPQLRMRARGARCGLQIWRVFEATRLRSNQNMSSDKMVMTMMTMSYQVFLILRGQTKCS